MLRYAIVISGCTWRKAETTPTPMIPRNRLTANEIRVPMNVTSRTRTGITYQRGGRAWDFGGIHLTYTIQTEFIDEAAAPTRAIPSSFGNRFRNRFDLSQQENITYDS